MFYIYEPSRIDDYIEMIKKKNEKRCLLFFFVYV